MADSTSAQQPEARPFQFTGRIRSFRHAQVYADNKPVYELLSR
jgi:hypothetical protein